MGLRGIGMTELLVVLLIVVTIFGTKRLKDIGADLGGAIKGFRKAMHADEESQAGRLSIDEISADEPSISGEEPAART